MPLSRATPRGAPRTPQYKPRRKQGGGAGRHSSISTHSDQGDRVGRPIGPVGASDPSKPRNLIGPLPTDSNHRRREVFRKGSQPRGSARHNKALVDFFLGPAGGRVRPCLRHAAPGALMATEIGLEKDKQDTVAIIRIIVFIII